MMTMMNSVASDSAYVFVVATVIHETDYVLHNNSKANSDVSR